MAKLKNALIFLSALMIIAVLMLGCERKGALNDNLPPIIEITSYEGVDSLGAVDSLNAVLFQQKIYWNAYDTDGVIESFAYRVLDENGSPITTYGHEVIDDDGWVYHYQEGADETIPLEATEAREIWTKDVYAVINFPANIDGDSAKVVSAFQVKCKDNGGMESNTATKYFNAESAVPKALVQSTKGDISGKTLGKGFVLQFSMTDGDPYIEAVADHYEFKLKKVKTVSVNDSLTEVVEIPWDGTPEGGYVDEWYSTEDLNDISKFMITSLREEEPILRPNLFVNDTPQDSTIVYVKVTDIAGIESDPSSTTFYVRDGFFPETLIYNGVDVPELGDKQPINDTWVLGNNHFTTNVSKEITKVIPQINTVDGIHYSMPFWIDEEGNHEAVWSTDLAINLHWGFHGEYGETLDNGTSNVTNNPNDKLLDTVVDVETGDNYFSEIVYMDLRLDDEAFVYPPLPASIYNITDDEGNTWLRVPAKHSLAKKTRLLGLEDGHHKFEVRAVDLQGVADPTPAVYEFNLVKPIAAADKEGILIIDNDQNHPFFSPDATIDDIYQNEILADYNGTVDFKDRVVDGSTANYEYHYKNNYFALTDIQQYKTIIWHSEDGTAKCEFDIDACVMNLYLQGGGNIVLSGGRNLIDVQEKLSAAVNPVLYKYFGLPISLDVMETIKRDETVASYTALAFFQKALPKNGFSEEIPLSSTPFNNLVANNDGLGPISYFEDAMLLGSTPIFGLGCKMPVENDASTPTQDEYDLLNNKTVAIKKVTNDSKCYMFGFPLSYMDTAKTRTMMNQIINEIESGIAE